MIHRLRLCLAAATLLPLAAALTGCGLGSSSFSKSATAGASAQRLGGNIHGGQQSIAGATITLWAAGTTGTTAAGYGANATSVATAVSDVNGNFGFDNAVTGASPCKVGQYLYVTATGGAPVGGVANTSSAMMAAIPTPCNTGTIAPTASQFVYINEVTTVAAVWSLQQFMKITPGGVVPWMIGAPASNVNGLASAFQTSTNLASIVTGSSATSSTSNAVSNTVGGLLYTTVIRPDYSKINTLANILASCINTSSMCSGLFADTTPSGATAPTDTIQVAYYLATNPAGLTMPAHGNAAGSPSYLCGAYPSASAPFQPSLTCASTYEWTISVSWKTTNPSALTTGTLDAASVAIDQTGNIWVGAGSGYTNGAVNEFNNAGQLLIAPVANVTIPAYNLNYVVGVGTPPVATGTPLAFTGVTQALGYGRPNSIAIDTNNNAWFGSYGAASPGTLVNGTTSVPTGVVLEVSPTGGASGFLAGSNAGALAIDGNNNIYLGDIPQTGKYYLSELTAASTYQTLNAGNGRGSSIFNTVFADAAGYGLGLSSSTTTCTAYTILRNNSDQEAVGTNTTTNITAPNCVYNGAIDAAGNIWGTANGNLYYINTVAGSVTTPVVTTVTGSTNTAVTTAGGTGGLDNTAGVAVDGAGNVWVVNRLSSSVSGANGVSELVPTTTGGTTTVVALSPSAAGVYGFGSGAGIAGANNPVIDASGNIWITTTGGSYLNFLVGAAAPVITPTSLQLKNNAVGVRP